MSRKSRVSRLASRPIRRAKYHTHGPAGRYFLCPYCLKAKQVIRRGITSSGVIESYACKVCRQKVSRYIEHRRHVQRLAGNRTKS